MPGRGLLAGKTALIFDLDGTLVDTDAIHRSAYEGTFRAQGIDSFDYDRHLGQRTDEVVAQILAQNDLPAEPARIAAIARQKQQAARALVEGGLEAVPGAVHFVGKAAAAGFRLAIGTGASRAGALGCLEAVQLRSFFHVIVTGDDVERGKPAPDIFLKGVEQLGARADECLVLEDSPSGFQAARAANLDCVIVVDTRHKFSGKDEAVWFSSYDELSEQLD